MPNAGLRPRHFSFNVPGGRCDVCEGDGTVTVEMQFLADIELPCEECNGTRYKSAVLDIKYKGKNINDVLNMTVKEALAYFAGHPEDRRQALRPRRSRPRLRPSRPIRHHTLRRRSPARQTRLAPRHRPQHSSRTHQRHSRQSPQPHPLHPRRAHHRPPLRRRAKLLAAFRKLIDGGGSLLVIEHNLDVIKSADWVIDMGPEGGTAGGQIVAVGTPEEIAANAASHTGHWLAPVLKSIPSKSEPELQLTV